MILPEFEDWLTTVCTPVRVEVIRDGFTLIQNIDASAMDEIQINLLSMVGNTDTYDLLTKTTTELAFYSTKVLDLFDITLDDATYTAEAQTTVNAIMRTILNLDSNELSERILQICDAEESPLETLAALVAEFTTVDSEAILELVKDVSPGLIDRIRTINTEQLSMTETTATQLLPAYIPWLKTILVDVSDRRKQDNATDLILNYALTTGRLGLPLKSYVAMFSKQLIDDTDLDRLAEDWIIIAIYANTDTDQILNTVTGYFNSLYPSIDFSQQIRRRMSVHIKKWNNWL